MLTRLRAALAVLMLAGFYLVAAGILAALGGGTVWVWANHPGPAAFKLSLVTLAVASAVGAAVIRAVRARPEGPSGRLVSPDEAPQLWQAVQELAEIARTAPPAEIVLVGSVNAAVTEDTRLMGLIGGRRRLYLGIPLLIGFDVAQLRSVIAHELGHYSGKHTRLGAINYRGRLAVLGTLSGLSGRFSGWLLRGYASLYFMVEAAVSRRQELEADQASVSAVGSATASRALRELPVLDAAWDFYVERYVASAWEDGQAPEDLFGGFAELLAARLDELDRLRGQELPGRHTRWDSHPPIAARVAAMAGMAGTAGPDRPADARPARVLLPDFDRICRELGAERAAAQGKQLTSWPELTAASVLAADQREADRIYRVVARIAGTPTGDLGSLLALVGSGRAPELAHALSPQAPGEQAVTGLAEAVEILLRVAAVRSGRATWRHSWSGPAELVGPDGTRLDLGEVAALLVRPESLDEGRAGLAAAQIDVDQGQQVERTATVRGAEVIGGLGNVKVNGERRDLLILTEGLIMVPCPKSTQGGKQRMLALVDVGPVDLAARHGVLTYDQIARARLLKRTPVGVELHLHDGGTVTIQESWSGDRLTKDSDGLLARLAAPEATLVPTDG